MLGMRSERLKRGWSLTTLSVLTGIEHSNLSRLERGQVVAYPGWRKRIAAAFEMSEEFLFTEATGDGQGSQDQRRETLTPSL